MDQLRELRDQIDQIDRQMVALFEQRMSVVCRVAEFKREQGMPILQSDREKICLLYTSSAKRFRGNTLSPTRA